MSWQTLVLTTLSVLLLGMSEAANAEDVTTKYAYWDVDTLTFESDAVVEGRFIQQGLPTDAHCGILRITAIHSGGLKVGQTVIVTGADYFFNPHHSGDKGLLDARDHLVLFLIKANHNRLQDPPPGIEVFTPIFLGTRLVVRGRVCGFESSDKADFAVPPYQIPNADAVGGIFGPLKTVVEFRREIRLSRDKTSAWRDCIARPPNAIDIPILLALLRERYRPASDAYFNPADLPAEDAANRLVEIHDLAAIEQGVAANKEMFWIFHKAFTHPDDRDYLLRMVQDRTLLASRRELFARFLQETGSVYRTDSDKAGTRPGEQTRPDARNSSWLARIANAASSLSNAGDDRLAAQLIAALEGFALDGVKGRRDPGVELDLHDAADMLIPLFRDGTTTGAVRFQIELTMRAIGEPARKSLKSKCGPIVTLAKPYTAAPLLGSPSAPATLLEVEGDFRAIEGGKVTASYVVLEPTAGGKTYVLPSIMSDREYYPESNMGVIDNIEPPADLKPGMYHVFYRLMNGADVLSDGYGFDTMVRPTPPNSQTYSQASSQMLKSYRSGPWPMNPPALPAPPAWPLRTPWQVLHITGWVLLLPFVLLLRVFIRSRRERRRARKGLCPQCAYDLRMTVERCSECGWLMSKGVERGRVRRCAAGIACVILLFTCLTATVMWFRSYCVTDCATRTAPARADSFYAARGALLIQLTTIDGPPGWSYDRGDPAGFPRTIAECGHPQGHRFAGIEYSSEAKLGVVPFAWPVALGAGITAMLIYWMRAHRNRKLPPTSLVSLKQNPRISPHV